MDKEFNWLADVILGSRDEITPPAREVPDLPLDDPLFKARRGDSIPRTSAVDDLCAQLDRAELIDQLCPIPTEARIEADVRKFSPEPPVASGFDSMLSKLIEEILPSVEGMKQLTPETTAGVSRVFDTFSKRATPSRRKQINDRLEAHGLYEHGVMHKWNKMLVAFDTDAVASLSENELVRKARSFLAEAA